MEETYIIKEGKYGIKTPETPKIEDYYDISETAEEREMRIYLYSEIKEVKNDES